MRYFAFSRQKFCHRLDLGAWNSTEPTSFANEWVKHIRNGEFLQENGPLWFCLALLIFSLVYVAFRAFRPGADGPHEDGPSPNIGKLIAFGLAMASLTFLLRLALPSGTSFLNMHLSRKVEDHYRTSRVGVCRE